MKYFLNSAFTNFELFHISWNTSFNTKTQVSTQKHKKIRLILKYDSYRCRDHSRSIWCLNAEVYKFIEAPKTSLVPLSKQKNSLKTAMSYIWNLRGEKNEA